MPQITNKIFKTNDQEGNENMWLFSRPKEGGAHSAGTYGGFYRCGNKYCLVKQDPEIAPNIAEFLASKIYNEIAPEVSAHIQLVNVNDAQQNSPDGRKVYLVSEFIPGWESDLYTAVQKTLKRNPKRSPYKFLETTQLVRRLIIRSSELAGVFRTENQKGNYLNFGQVSATSLLVNNIDTNVGNLGVVLNEDGSKKLAIVDYGAAFRNMTPKINPHSFIKYIPSHMFNHEGWNNFLFYPEPLKLTPEFVFELDKASKIDLGQVVSAAFGEIKSFYGIRPIIDFAVRAGFSLQLEDATLSALESAPALANQKIELIKVACINSLKLRQRDLSRFSAQIKLDLCVKVGRASKKCSLDGSFVDKTGRAISFNDVIFDHFDYFKEIILGKEKFKFRKSAHKHNPRLIEDVKNQLRVVFASFLLVAENRVFQETYNIRSMDDAIRALQTDALDRKILESALNEKFFLNAKGILIGFEQATMVTKFNTCLEAIGVAGISLSVMELRRLEMCPKLQDAIIELHSECAKLSLHYGKEQNAALSAYKRQTMVLAIQGVESYKRGYAAVEQQAISSIDHNTFTKCARAIGNIIFMALVAASVIGLFAIAYTGRTQGLFLFRGPEQELPNIAAKFNDLKEPEILSL